MTNTVILTVVILTVLGLLLALILFWVAKKFKVEEDPRIDEVEKVMPGATCGGGGFAGCRIFCLCSSHCFMGWFYQNKYVAVCAAC